VVLQGVRRGVGGAEDLDVEALEEGARGVLGRREPLFEVVVEPLGVPDGRLLGDAEEPDQLGVEPEAGWCAVEEVEILAEALPDPTVVPLHGRAVARWDA
jgi:hypothetical protein